VCHVGVTSPSSLKKPKKAEGTLGGSILFGGEQWTCGGGKEKRTELNSGVDPFLRSNAVSPRFTLKVQAAETKNGVK
jgi:hypothetical protein